MSESIRLQSFKDTMIMAGIDYEILQDMFDDTWELFESIRQAAETGIKNENVVLNALNNEFKSESIIYHFKARSSGTSPGTN